MNAQPRLSFTRPLVVGSVSTAEAWSAACAAESLPCDVVELRADGLPADTDWAELAQMRCCCPVLVTVRHESHTASIGSHSAGQRSSVPCIASLLMVFTYSLIVS